MSRETHPTKNYSDISSQISIGYQDLLAALLERIWLIALCLVVALVTGLAIIKRSPVVYNSVAVLLIDVPKNVVNIQEVTSENPRSSEVIQNMLQMIASAPLMERVTKKLESEGIVGAMSPTSQMRVVPMLRKGTTIIDLHVEHTVPEMSQKIANTIANEFIRMNVQERSGGSEAALEFLFSQLKDVKEKLASSELALQSYRETTRAAALDDVELKDLNLRQNEINKRRLALEADLKAIQNIGDKPEALLGITSIATDPSVTNFQSAIAKQNEIISGMTQRYTEEHPKLIKARRELQSLRAALLTAARDAVKTVEPKYLAELEQEKRLEQLTLSKSRDAIGYKALLRDVQANKELFEMILRRTRETDVTTKMEFDNVRITQLAGKGVKIKPDQRKVMVASIVAGLVAGVTLSLLLHSFDSSLKTVDQAEEILGLPVLSAVPESQGNIPKPKIPKSQSGVGDITPATRESFRTLLVSLSLLGRKEEGRVILFTSAVPAEGKTFCSYHCATHLAGQGARTLLIDSDLRKPYLHHIVTKSKLGIGVTEALTGQNEFSDVVQTTNVENLFFISAGSRSPNPPKLLVDRAFQRVIDAYQDKFDYIILDSAPVNAVADTLLMVQHVQRVCLITRAGSTPRKATLRAIDFLRQANKEPVGVVLNRFMDRRGLYYYYHYSYHKSYGRDSAYGLDNKSSGRG